MAIKRTKAPPKRQPPKPDPAKDRFLAVGGGPWDGILRLERRRLVDKSFDPPRTTIVGELPDVVPVGDGGYRRTYDPESNTNMYVWKEPA